MHSAVHVSPFTVLESILLLRKCELDELGLLNPLLHHPAHIEHPFDLLNVSESGLGAGVWRSEE